MHVNVANICLEYERLGDEVYVGDGCRHSLVSLLECLDLFVGKTILVVVIVKCIATSVTSAVPAVLLL